MNNLETKLPGTIKNGNSDKRSPCYFAKAALRTINVSQFTISSKKWQVIRKWLCRHHSPQHELAST